MSRSFQIRFDFVSVCSSISGLAVGFSVSDLLVIYRCIGVHSFLSAIGLLCSRVCIDFFIFYPFVHFLEYFVIVLDTLFSFVFFLTD